jgi:osmotically-inducible protein OsmY
LEIETVFKCSTPTFEASPSPRPQARHGLAGLLRATAMLTCLAALPGCSSVMVAMDADTIEDNPGNRTFYQRLADETIETKAIVNLHAADPGFDQAHLAVQSYNGFVLVAGQVASEDLRQKANDVIREIRDVRRIYNELEVAAPTSAMTRASDAWIASKVKTFLLTARETPGMRTKVVAENGVVFLLGMVTREEADRIAAQAADVSGVQRVVRLFEYVNG